ncbi:MAG: TRAP transporter substrate-binding protein DctP [Rhodospirillaceae bacterium]|nr:TRAP transporter substrate-binding protein DctP [Rhodospirillaceae bacterium]
MRSVLLGSLAAAALLAAGPALAQTYQLNVNTALTTGDPIYQGLERFKAAVEERTDGDLEVRLFPGSQLGTDEDVLEQARAGANVAVVVDGGRLAEFAPELAILGAPYIANDFDELRVLVTSDLFDTWAGHLRTASGHEILSFNWYQGQRNLLTNVAVRAPADLDGIRMRTPGAPVWLETIRAMGATPTPMGWTEVYTALQQGVIDAAEAQDPATYGSRLYEVVDHITLTGHIQLITGLVTSADWFAALPEDYQAIVKEEALAAGDFASQLTIDSLGEYQRLMGEAGVTIDAIDVTPFVEATATVYEILGLNDLRAQVNEVLGR